MMQIRQLNNINKIAVANELQRLASNCRVFMCIGTEKVIADSLGPKVGKLLNEKMEIPIYIYGLDALNITAQNLIDCYQFIKGLHKDEKIIVIDAGVGEAVQIGEVQVVDHGIVPGAATNKNLPMVGDASIVGIVANKNLKDFYNDDNSKQQLIDTLANFIADSIILANSQFLSVRTDEQTSYAQQCNY